MTAGHIAGLVVIDRTRNVQSQTGSAEQAGTAVTEVQAPLRKLSSSTWPTTAPERS